MNITIGVFWYKSAYFTIMKHYCTAENSTIPKNGAKPLLNAGMDIISWFKNDVNNVNPWKQSTSELFYDEHNILNTTTEIIERLLPRWIYLQYSGDYCFRALRRHVLYH